MQETLLIVKPEAVAGRKVGEVLRRAEAAGFTIRALRLCRLSRAQAQAFYEEHAGKPFYESLVSYMSGGPCVAAVLEAEEAVASLRRLVGATDPQKASAGTIRADLGRSLQENAVHATDSDGKVEREIGFFFSQTDLIG